MFRIGIAPQLELRLGWEGYQRISSPEASPDSENITEGVTDGTIGLKYQAPSKDSQSFAWGSILELGLPFGSSDISAGEPEPGAKFLWAYELNDRFSLAGNINLTYAFGDAGRYSEIGTSSTLSTELSEKAGIYLEYFGLTPTQLVPEADEYYLNTGITYAVSTDQQLDARIGCGLTDQSADWFAGFGFAIRL